jgi:hypothetical protein
MSIHNVRSCVSKAGTLVRSMWRAYTHDDTYRRTRVWNLASCIAAQVQISRRIWFLLHHIKAQIHIQAVVLRLEAEASEAREHARSEAARREASAATQAAFSLKDAKKTESR